MKILQTYLLLLSAALLLTGFSWGSGSDPCKEALENAGTLDTIRDEVQRRQAEAKIIAQCPDGAAAHLSTRSSRSGSATLISPSRNIDERCSKLLLSLEPAGIWGCSMPRKG